MASVEQSSGSTAGEQSTYFNLLAEIGHTKHVGGQAATARLIELADVKPGDHVLDVGCGVGIAAVYLAKEYGCRVTGVDITPRMLERAQERVRREGAGRLIKLRVANMSALPFADDSFDAAIAESVLTFAADKLHVVNELARVVKPGGTAAFTEAVWVAPPPPEKADFMARASGMPQGILAHDEWRAILEASDLSDVVAEANALTAREESKSQYGRVAPADYLRAFPGFFRVISKPQYRQVFSKAFASMPKEYFTYVGYGIYGGVAAAEG